MKEHWTNMKMGVKQSHRTGTNTALTKLYKQASNLTFGLELRSRAQKSAWSSCSPSRRTQEQYLTEKSILDKTMKNRKKNKLDSRDYIKFNGKENNLVKINLVKIHIYLWKGFTCYSEYRRNSKISNKSQHNLKETIGFNGHLSKHDT